MATQYDLTPVIAKHLDRHLVFPLLEFLGGRGLYDAADIEAAKLALIEKTNMVDYAVDIYQQLNQTDEVGAPCWLLVGRLTAISGGTAGAQAHGPARGVQLCSSWGATGRLAATRLQY